MGSRLFIAALVVAAAFAALAFVTRRQRDAANKPVLGSSELHPPPFARIAEIARSGHKIEAIKLLRENTGLGLAEAKEVVERMQERVPAVSARGRADDDTEPRGTHWLSDVRAAIRAGDTITAIKIYRDHSGVGLKEAKEAVDALREQD